jgi:deazaflavin-dependent oxidoreductase (nitroreductase family)
MSAPDLNDLHPYWNCRITTRGRKSGEPRQVTIWFALGEGVVYLTGSKTLPQWCRNIAAHGEVTLEIGGRELTGDARIIEDPAEADAVRRRFVNRYLLARLSRPFGGYTDSIPVEVRIR